MIMFPVLWVAFYSSMILSVGLWVIRDARARESDQPITWAVALVFTPIGLPYYLYRRYRRAGLSERQTPPTKRDRLLTAWASASLGSFLLSALLAPPDPVSQILFILVGLGILLPVVYLLIYRGKHQTIRLSQ